MCVRNMFDLLGLYSAQNVHVSIRLEKLEILELAKYFPSEFCHLIKNLRMIRSHEGNHTSHFFKH